MTKKELSKRYLFFIIGLFISSTGISFTTKAMLGISPISGVPYVLSLGLPLTLGTFTFLYNTLFIVGQIIILGREFDKMQLIQFPVLILFGYFIDLTMSLLSVFHLGSYLQQMLFLLIGCVILAFGISMQVTANVVILSGEALIKVIATKLGKEFGIVKVCFDTTMVILTCIISLSMLHRIEGIREGTVIAALLVGFIVRYFNKQLKIVNNKLLTDEKPLYNEI